MKSPVFVVGSGRTGTHFITRSIIAHPDVVDLYDGNENRIILNIITRAALKNSQKLPASILLYYEIINRTIKKIFLDQNHPNLFFIDHIISRFPNSKFIGMWRDNNATVASMLKHSGTRGWLTRFEDFPFPNQFLGNVTSQEYSNLSLPARAALRVVNHKNRIFTASKTYPSSFRIQRYETLVSNHDVETRDIFSWLGIERIADLQNVSANPESLSKWRSYISQEDTREIEVVFQRFREYPELLDRGDEG